MRIFLAIIVIVATVLLATVAANATMFKTFYPGYARSRSFRGKQTSKLLFLLTHGSILDPVNFLEARSRPGLALSSTLTGILTTFMLVALWVWASRINN